MVNKNFDNGNPFDFGKISLEYANIEIFIQKNFTNNL